MEILKGLNCAIFTLLASILVVLMVPAYGQTAAACTSSMITSFSPCLNFITGSTNGGFSPSADCCNSLASLISSSADCSCLLLSGSIPYSLPSNIPFNLPINPSLASTLPNVCKSTSMPSLQCKGSAAPPPVPVSPGLDSTSPSTTPLAPAVTPTAAIPANQPLRPFVIPSSAVKLQNICSLSLVLLVLGTILLNKS